MAAKPAQGADGVIAHLIVAARLGNLEHRLIRPRIVECGQGSEGGDSDGPARRFLGRGIQRLHTLFDNSGLARIRPSAAIAAVST